jgi:hypothetical protein
VRNAEGTIVPTGTHSRLACFPGLASLILG